MDYAPDVLLHRVGDMIRLQQILSNLIANAIKFSDKGGLVKMTLIPGKDKHAIAVRDYGPGIPEEFRGRIFARFAQADATDSRAKGGTGLGLAIVHEIMQQMGGSVRFETQTGEGTEFCLFVPASRGAREGEEEA